METTTGIYMFICMIFFLGLFILISEKNKLELLKIKRWRYKIQVIDLQTIFLFKPYYEFLKRRNKENKEVEIWEGISFMRNIISNGEEYRLGSDSLLEELINRKDSLAPVFSGSLQLMRQNQMKEALNYFTEHVGTENGKEFFQLILNWDILDEEYLMESLISFQKNISDARLTKQKRKDEMLSNIVYVPVVANIMLVLLNFIYIGFYKEQIEMLTLII